MKRFVSGLLPLVLMLNMALPARAAWMGLADGNYQVDLNCTFSSQIACPSTTSGTLSVSGGGVVAMDFTIDGLTFAGDAFDGPVSTPLADFEGSTLSTASPYQFLSLRLITSGQVGNFSAGDRWWVYCHTAGNPNTCSPNTTGLWTAQLLPSGVPEPRTLALLAAALALLGWGRRRRG